MTTKLDRVQAAAIAQTLSHPRLSTYLREMKTQRAALALYEWNAEIAAAFLVPLQLCEVAIRNGIAEAIEDVYGPDWPWSPVFIGSLPFATRRELTRVNASHQLPGKVVADLKLYFWVDMLTRRHDTRLWDIQLPLRFANFPPNVTIGQRRSELRSELDRVRILRNRIAHHEPIFARDLRAEYDRIRLLISRRCHATASWLDVIEKVTQLLASRPALEGGDE